MIKEVAHKIIDTLPYGKDFLFVDSISYVDSERIIGHYTFKKMLFYESHFKHLHIIPELLLLK